MAKRKSLDVTEAGSKEIRKKDILEALDRLEPGLSARGVDAEAGRYLFMGDRVAVYSDNVCVVVSFPTGFSGSVSAREFHKLVSGVSTDIINLELRDNQVVANAGTDSSFGLAYMEPGEAHEKVRSLEEEGLQWRDFTEDVKRAMVLCAFSASKDVTRRPEMTGVHVGNGEVLSSDNHRISWYQLGEGSGMRRSFLVPAASVVHLIHYDMDKYSLAEGWVHFRGKDATFSARLLAAEDFPQAKGFFPEEEMEGFELPKELVGALDKALVLLRDDHLLDKNVRLSFSGDRIVCEVEKRDLGWVREVVPLVGGPEKSVEMEANPVFLKEIMKYSTKVVLVDENRMLFLSENFKHLIALG